MNKTSYATEHVTSTLRAARTARGLSQRELSVNSAVPQGHISRIENGSVDLRLSNLVALARALDLELMLVPRQSVPAVRSVARSAATGAPGPGKAGRRVRRELALLEETLGSLPPRLQSRNDVGRLRRHVRELSHFAPALLDIEVIRDVNRALDALVRGEGDPAAIGRPLARLVELRNALAHNRIARDEAEPARPVYILEDDG